MKQAIEPRAKAKGPEPDLDVLLPVLFDKVIPRLLRPLESNGWSANPSLVRGDFQYANAGVDAGAGAPVIFDACCFHAHHECGLDG